MNFLPKRFSRPYPAPGGWRNALISGLVGGVFVALFLFFVRPFGTVISPGKEVFYLWICLQFGLVTLFCALFCGGLTVVFPKIFDEKNWTVGREILYYIFFISLIGSANFVFAHFKFGSGISFSNFLTWQWMTLVVGIFPTVFGVFFKEIKLLRQFSMGAADLTKQIESHPHPQKTPENQSKNQSEKPIILEGDNQNESLRLLPAQVFYLSAADNYVQVYFLENGVLKNRMLRGSLKKMEDQLAENPIFYRCHRTFIVNLEKVLKVSGNAQGYKLHLVETDFLVPVSRSLNEEIKQKFEDF